MNQSPDPLRAAHRRARLLGGFLCFGTPALLAGLILAGVVPPGEDAPEGPLLQIGHAFTGLVFLSTAWVVWRRGVVLKGFRRVPAAGRPRVVLRESLLYAGLFELSAAYGLVYWLLVGRHAGRHVAGFMLLAPLLFLAFVPTWRQWDEAARPDPGEAP